MLIDTLCELPNYPSTSIRRTHFHRFMLDVHQRIHMLRQEGHRGDLVTTVARQLVKEAPILCFDEFQVTDGEWWRRLFKSRL